MKLCLPAAAQLGPLGNQTARCMRTQKERGGGFPLSRLVGKMPRRVLVLGLQGLSLLAVVPQTRYGALFPGSSAQIRCSFFIKGTRTRTVPVIVVMALAKVLNAVDSCRNSGWKFKRHGISYTFKQLKTSAEH